jgi:hypothetical protein
MQSADRHDVHTLTVVDPHRHVIQFQAPLIPQILLGITNVSNRTGMEYPCVTTGTCKIDINYMYIKYTFVSGNNLAGLLVFKVLGAVALPMTIPFAVEALDYGLHLGCLGRNDNTLAVPLRLLDLWALCRFARLLKVCTLVDQHHVVLLLDFHLRSFGHSEQLWKGLSHPLHIVV